MILDELESIEANLSPRSASMIRATRRYLAARTRPFRHPDWDLSRRRDIVVRSSGSLAHVYFNVTARPMELSEIAVLHPELLPRLLQHPGVGLVIARDSDDVIVMGPKGALTLSEQAVVRGEHPLATLADGPLAAEELRQMALFPHSGDLIVLGAWEPEAPQRVTAFEDQVASHGGLGGEQLYPFIVHADQHELVPERLTNARTLYAFFCRAYHQQLTES